jgi:ribonucleoside-diphosphate reductase alpha chain
MTTGIKPYLGITIDYSRDSLISDFALATLKDRYMLSTETSPQETFARPAVAFCEGDLSLAQRIYDYASKLWFSYSTPILSNGGTGRGLPISCFLNYVGDSRQGLNDHWAENTWLSSMGGGIGGYWGDIRSDGTGTSSGSRSTGVIPFLKVVDSQVLAVSQGITRRGAYAAYMDISHPEIEEFLLMRRPTGGDPNRKCLNLHHGVNLTDDFMNAVDSDLPWDLIDPKSKAVVKTVSARKLWEDILILRVETGEPYLHFIDTTNAAVPECHKELGLTIRQSNLCSEIVLPTNEERTAVCCLSSVNLEYFEQWKDTSMVQDLIIFLDNVLQYFIDNAPQGMSKAVYSASRERSLGLGAMGFHSFLQSKGVPMESALAESWNRKMFSYIRSEAEIATVKLGTARGSASDYIRYACGQFTKDIALITEPRRNVYLMAIAPNASSSIIANSSPSIEPVVANVFTHKTDSGSFEVKNKYLDHILFAALAVNHSSVEETEKELKKVWKSIVEHEGSVQHLDILSDTEKLVFKTAFEIDQNWLVHHAAVRQQWIDQAQSVNLFLTSDVEKSTLHKVHFSAWKKGLKTLYYCRSKASERADKLTTKVEREVLVEFNNSNDGDVCLSCQG